MSEIKTNVQPWLQLSSDHHPCCCDIIPLSVDTCCASASSVQLLYSTVTTTRVTEESKREAIGDVTFTEASLISGYCAAMTVSSTVEVRHLLVNAEIQRSAQMAGLI